jgi:FHA domain-containing protein/cytochrome c3-like protein
MSDVQQSTFKIIRDDRSENPKIILSEGLRIGRLPDCDIWLNHPKVSRLHAGISRIEGYFFLINLSASSATTLNGRVIPFNEAEALTEGDEIQIGPYFLEIEETGETLVLRVSLEFAVDVGTGDLPHKVEAYRKQLTDEKRITGPLQMRISGPLVTPTGQLAQPTRRQTGRLSEVLNALQVFWSKRTREKAGRKSPLHPQTPPRPGKFQFNWKPTRDLVRPWPFAIFIWAAVLIATLSSFAVFAHKNAFAPRSLSAQHTSKTIGLVPAIAIRPNGNSCTSCHAIGISARNREKMNANCAACHQTEAFVATIVPAHRDAGLTCISCHAEHRGAEFRPLISALESCAKCHSDQNTGSYNRKRVHTPHGGTFGYPVKNGEWIWTGLSAEELALKPEVESFLKKTRVSASQTREWRNAQFHGIHLAHIPVVQGLDGVINEGGVKVLSCSSCHESGYMGSNVDRNYPRTTCGRCHNADIFNEPAPAANRLNTPSCTSCHVQHVKDTHWASRFHNVERRLTVE